MRLAPTLPGELIPCASVWHDPGITPCCKTLYCAANAQLSNPRSWHLSRNTYPGYERSANCGPQWPLAKVPTSGSVHHVATPRLPPSSPLSHLPKEARVSRERLKARVDVDDVSFTGFGAEGYLKIGEYPPDGVPAKRV